MEIEAAHVSETLYLQVSSYSSIHWIDCQYVQLGLEGLVGFRAYNLHFKGLDLDHGCVVELENGRVIEVVFGLRRSWELLVPQ